MVRETGERVPVVGNCALGRAIGNHVVLLDDRVSRRHATIHVQGEQEFWLVDLGSRNGTYLNGRRVSQPTRLRDTDRIQAGPFQLVFRHASAGASATVAGGTDQTLVDMRSVPCWLLVCDITGFSVLARQRSAEELAVLVGGWFARCQEVIEDHGGTINKYLGDGLFAYWLAGDPVLAHVGQSLRDLRSLQEEGNPGFRLVVHLGPVVMGGLPSSGEESLAGPEVNFVFRMERLASQLQLPRLASVAVVDRLAERLAPTAAGDHELAGFEGRHTFFTF